VKRTFFVLLALALVLRALPVPHPWAPFAGQLRVAGLFPTTNAVGGPDLPVPLVSQYQGLATDNVNCGPASIAAIVQYLRPDSGNTTDAALLVAGARDKTGEPTGETYLPGLAHALDAFGVPSAPLYASDGGGDPLAAVRVALAHGRPVIVTVGGAALGRGPTYGDHFVVIIGMNPQAGLVDVVDPDTQAPRNPQWMPGGRQQWPASLVRTAMAAAQEHDALGVVAGAQRAGVLPSPLVILPPQHTRRP
jgi:hypothetical protein